MEKKTLPERWAVRITEENCEVLEEWRLKQPLASKNLKCTLDEARCGYLLPKRTGDDSYQYWGYYPIQFTEITFEDFKELVLGIPEPSEPCETSKSQIQKIDDYLKSGKRLSKLESLKMFGVWNTGDVIYKLRKKYLGTEIVVKTEMVTNNGKTYAEYFYENKTTL